MAFHGEIYQRRVLRCGWRTGLGRGNVLLIRAGSVGVRLAWTATMALAALRVLHTRGAMASRKGDPNLQVQEGV